MVPQVRGGKGSNASTSNSNIEGKRMNTDTFLSKLDQIWPEQKELFPRKYHRCFMYSQILTIYNFSSFEET